MGNPENISDGDPPAEPRRPAEFSRPWTITVASVIWIVWGGLAALYIALAIVCDFRDFFHGGPINAMKTGGILAVVMAAFLYVLYAGIQTFRGRARDTLARGIASVLLGPCILLYWAAGGGDSLMLTLMGLFWSTSPVAAGVLGLTGRRKYRAWRQARNEGGERDMPAATIYRSNDNKPNSCAPG
jgi:hypothetical protein